jgi:hypothetical protein
MRVGSGLAMSAGGAARHVRWGQIVYSAAEFFGVLTSSPIVFDGAAWPSATARMWTPSPVCLMKERAMDGSRFDALARSLHDLTRRNALRLFGGSLLAPIAGSDRAIAAKTCALYGKKCGKKKKKKKVKCCSGLECQEKRCVCPNGSLDCNGTCVLDGECCSDSECSHLNEACKDGECNASGRCVATNQPNGLFCIDLDRTCSPLDDCECLNGLCEFS